MADASVDGVGSVIYYRFDIEASQLSCTQVADYLFDNYMRPNRATEH